MGHHGQNLFGRMLDMNVLKRLINAGYILMHIPLNIMGVAIMGDGQVIGGIAVILGGLFLVNIAAKTINYVAFGYFKAFNNFK
jgi:hypothetical protein